MQKASHIIKLPQCPFPNHIFTAVHTRFTRILACACILRLGLYVDLHGAGLRNNLGGQKIEKKSIFSLLFHKLVRKGFPHHLHHFFGRKSINFTPIGAQFEACIVSFDCVLRTPCSKKRYFLRTKMPLNQFFTPGFSNIPPTHIKQHYNLCIIEFRLSDERR